MVTECRVKQADLPPLAAINWLQIREKQKTILKYQGEVAVVAVMVQRIMLPLMLQMMMTQLHAQSVANHVNSAALRTALRWSPAVISSPLREVSLMQQAAASSAAAPMNPAAQSFALIMLIT